MPEDFNNDMMPAREEKKDGLGVRYDEYGMPIPEEESFEDVTAAGIRDAINANDSARGFCDCTTSVQLMKVRLREDPSQATEDDYEEIGGFAVKNFRADFYGFTPAFCAINLTFDTPEDMDYKSMWEILKRYREELEHNDDRGGTDYYLSLTLIPNRYSGRCFASLAQPLDFFRTVNPDSDFIESTIHLIFSYDTVTFQNVTMTQDEMVDYHIYADDQDS